jgi:hypothetical protein
MHDFLTLIRRLESLGLRGRNLVDALAKANLYPGQVFSGESIMLRSRSRETRLAQVLIEAWAA